MGKNSQNEKKIDKFTVTEGFLFNPFLSVKMPTRITEKMKEKEKANKLILTTGHTPAAKSTELCKQSRMLAEMGYMLDDSRSQWIQRMNYKIYVLLFYNHFVSNPIKKLF